MNIKTNTQPKCSCCRESQDRELLTRCRSYGCTNLLCDVCSDDGNIEFCDECEKDNETEEFLRRAS